MQVIAKYVFPNHYAGAKRTDIRCRDCADDHKPGKRTAQQQCGYREDNGQCDDRQQGQVTAHQILQVTGSRSNAGQLNSGGSQRALVGFLGHRSHDRASALGAIVTPLAPVAVDE
ncbi:Uncharacterised protein [Mycobacterium tuberculosis]|uniref:Uncharacterized protein n=1 Tax=Mycobacterium tuberculosis TaxID=1773 RepID=A0A0U0S2H5_MYCTX|nr:Uncharacterised protein [Mycobacterium tuberculosis]CNW57951.1 Uncharacterised protein [Mycobacterium tuberculosis]COV47846.1 Uncharacterised protein [Mycobacterium tuberculosis]COW38542.1 Uncharacterised protein [Mycobacterium tuberculosis]COW44736.1 Uncharacterised protein [Mycobacterium tuberculosis]